MINKQRCIYCGYKLGDTKEHIIPKSLITAMQYCHKLPISKPDNNVAPACKHCNNCKSQRFILPTHKSIHSSYINTPTVYIQDLAEWVMGNYKELQQFFQKEMNRLIYEVSLSDLNTVKSLYCNGYYDTLSDTGRGVPNNKFYVKYIADQYHT